jgi:hypothetical protein
MNWQSGLIYLKHAKIRNAKGGAVDARLCWHGLQTAAITITIHIWATANSKKQS